MNGDAFNRFDTILECAGRTDRQTVKKLQMAPDIIERWKASA